MPFLKFDEMPRYAGQYFGTASVHGDIVFNANAANAFRIHARFDRNYVSRFQAPRLPLCDPGVLMYFQAQTMTRAVDEKMGKAVAFQDATCRCVNFPAAHSLSHRRDRRSVRLQNRLIPRLDAFWRTPHKNRARNVAAIVAEYNTQVEHHQLIFPQSLGRRAGMRQSGPIPECNNRLKGRTGGPSFAHLIFDLGSDVSLADARLQQAYRELYNLSCQDGRFAHLRQF